MFIGRNKNPEERMAESRGPAPDENEAQSFVPGEQEEEVSPADPGTGEEEGEMIEEEMEAHPRKYWELPFLIGLGIFLLASILVGGYFLAKSFWSGDGERISIQNMPPVTEGKKETVPAAAEEPAEEQPDPEIQKLDPKEVSIKVLNGGAVAGSAGKVRDALLAKGYKKVEAANADGNYTGTTVFYYGENNKEAAEKVASDLKANYPAVKSKAAASAEEKSAPIAVILGK